MDGTIIGPYLFTPSIPGVAFSFKENTFVTSFNALCKKGKNSSLKKKKKHQNLPGTRATRVTFCEW